MRAAKLSIVVSGGTVGIGGTKGTTGGAIGAGTGLGTGTGARELADVQESLPFLD